LYFPSSIFRTLQKFPITDAERLLHGVGIVATFAPFALNTVRCVLAAGEDTTYKDRC